MAESSEREFLTGERLRAERERHASQARGRYRDHLVELLHTFDLSAPDLEALADAVLDRLFVVTPRDGHRPCSCGCHPRLPETELHEYGFACTCQLTPDERRSALAALRASMEAFWDSPQGQALAAQREAERAELTDWLDQHSGVSMARVSEYAPEQWEGTVDGHRFYFRERHESWRLELDVRPTSDIYRRGRTGGDVEGEETELVEYEEGDVIAEGGTTVNGYGTTLVDRARFIVGTIREHLGRQTCEIHTPWPRPPRPDPRILLPMVPSLRRTADMTDVADHPPSWTRYTVVHGE